MMSYPSIDSLVKKVDNKYTLVTLAAMRARELNDGAAPLVEGAEGKKTVSIALQEIDDGKITYADASRIRNR
ncbi:DNA-directed RNA polymerase subunit omega [Allisonella histaminiformans]|jgi:DNA-directed RNA polymerase subunit omega|uniref:DNA-directed RNA polymerase subunit omega n=1 Tax=Allisonella histaminiformans TaxID=209880 RepID=A0A1G5W8K8_9FIRM|nr:DNA-directed RNA polymerase subunit omega [Allisonella histaminiformans]PWL46516.1 MAG: DNA-directed RNA polymerase subunit omega [Veillonellaceae bacterium]MDD6870736.1 DNA-directed RNA polymerase subunit omega [Allisonella histaminiformans]MDY3956674.1 DNA-directed RNA polymerase subunit omega [Allisonella histaminiformans]MDY4540350.1 DNA-directed RNA polymerase subunit omega [Allisonella histaminiformans]SDA54403.1 DNA-directed RNA polymerase subunit omega [Allisonella histaminiformans]